MKFDKKITATTLQLVFLFFSVSTYAQLPSTGVSMESGVLDGVYIQEHIPTKRVIQYTHLREADVMWSKRVWRVLDIREKMNHPLFYPEEPLADRMSLWDVIKYGALTEGSLTVYNLNDMEVDDRFRFPVKGNINDPEFIEELHSFFGKTIQVPVGYDDETGDPLTDPETGDVLKKDTNDPYVSSDIIGYKIKEDWFFDKQRSVMDVRIVGIAPMVYGRNPVSQEIVGKQVLFWLYFPECRYVFQNFFVYNRQNEAMRMSFDDLFWKRQFSSFIEKEANVFDRQINQIWSGIDALLESKKIKEEMFKIEHDLWHL
jgi:gliding motility associated protien GldN